MISIEEMRAYKANAERAEEEKATALKREIVELEERILGMSDDMDEMINYGRVAVECGLIPTIDEHRNKDLGRSWRYEDKHNGSVTTYVIKPNCVYTDGIYHRLGFVSEFYGMWDCRNGRINGIGIENGGACGRFNLYYRNGKLWWEDDDGKGDLAKYQNEAYKEDLKNFIKGYGSWKKRVLVLVEATMKGDA